jgi:nucleotide-binding universal stress UspA family protein
MKKEIIIAVDGSMYSNHALSYVTELFAEEEEFHFRLSSWITASASIMPSAANPRDSLIPEVGHNKKEITAKRYLHKAKEKLLSAGIDKKRIHTTVAVSGYNIAAAIQQHVTKELPDALLLGRRGFKGITEMLMGSVSTALFRKCHSTPLWIIDGEVQHKDFFVPVDGTINSLLAVDHLAHILNGRKDVRICLFHCTALFGKKVTCDPELFNKHWEKEWCDKHLSGTNCLFLGPRQILLEAGIPDANIEILPEKTNLEEARGIISQARKQHCGTIVMGRRSAGMAKGLFGGVSDRTIKHVENLALWVIG